MNSIDPLEGAGASEAPTMIEAVLPGVVQVRTCTTRRGPRGGAGAGFIWSPDGFVMTNRHVVVGSNGKVEVVLTDDHSFDAEVIGSSRRLDLAMVRLLGDPVEDLPTPPVADSDALRVGELVFAVGHPWGRRGAVTAGIVSGLGSIGKPFGPAPYVQSDAYLAPGNSGGPLVNARGEVIGVNAMVSRGLSLAIPSNTAGAWATGGLRTGWRSRPRLGVRVQKAVLPTSSRNSAGQETGLVIADVGPGGPAYRAGLLVGDVLLCVAGEPVDDATSLRDALARVGDSVRLRVMRGGQVREIEADFGASARARACGA